MNDPVLKSRLHVKDWIDAERAGHADVKFPVDMSPSQVALHGITWHMDFIGNYLRRAELFGLDTPQGRQALGKAIVTALSCLEAATIVYDEMPMPGVPSGEIQKWVK